MTSVGVMAAGVNVSSAPLHVWPDASVPTTLSSTGAAEIGTGVQAATGVSVLGVRIWNPGLNTRTSRSAKLWESTGTNFTSGTKVREVTLPDKMATGWTDFSFSSAYVASATKWLVVSYDAGGGSFNDVGQVVNGLVSAVTSADGKVTFPANGAMFTTSADFFPGVNFGSTYWGVDVLYSG